MIVSPFEDIVSSAPLSSVIKLTDDSSHLFIKFFSVSSSVSVKVVMRFLSTE